MINFKVTIIGLGLIGGSIGLALKSKTGCTVVGFDTDEGAMKEALKLGAIDSGAVNIFKCISDSEIVFIATPISKVMPTLRLIAPMVKPGTLITDVASVKGKIMDEAMKIVGNKVAFIGGHPMAGKETSGIGVAEKDLFVGRKWILIPGKQSSKKNQQKLEETIKVIGGIPITIEAQAHDQSVAVISHLPFVVSNTLFNSATGSQNWEMAKNLAAGGFKDTTRLASGNPTMHSEIVLANRDNVLNELDSFISKLKITRNLIASGDGCKIESFFSTTKISRDKWLKEVFS